MRGNSSIRFIKGLWIVNMIKNCCRMLEWVYGNQIWFGARIIYCYVTNNSTTDYMLCWFLMLLVEMFINMKGKGKLTD